MCAQIGAYRSQKTVGSPLELEFHLAWMLLELTLSPARATNALT